MSMQRLNHFHGFLPEYEPYISPASPIRRGPMYSAYAELREWRLRTKAAMIKPPPPPPPPSLHVGLRKEEKLPIAKLPSNVAKMDNPGMTPRPGSKADMRRLGTMMAMKKGISSLKDMKEMKDFPHAFMSSSFDLGVFKEDKDNLRLVTC
ncbi:hypothetical protein J5N97_027826 [Dioscorea zingiberensis]|uniref:Uncharacterized protein n=1 Tax=Dioscorea zingiberensis TaxID=325984 RepID=A0A9D5H4B4_9LILI|nr:hypothetical protein J5N97_027826 [Dioscorea zingiberensis]